MSVIFGLLIRVCAIWYCELLIAISRRFFLSLLRVLRRVIEAFSLSKRVLKMLSRLLLMASMKKVWFEIRVLGCVMSLLAMVCWSLWMA